MMNDSPNTETMKADERFDIAICGAGYVGLATAVALKNARPSLAIVVLDAAPDGVWKKDGRASAIAAAASSMLEGIGVWDEIVPKAQPITEMVVTDSRTSDPVRPVFLTFSGDVREGEPFAHMVPNPVLNGALRGRAEELGVELRQDCRVDAYRLQGGRAIVETASGKTIGCRLLIAADGLRSRLRQMAGIHTVGTDYGQSGLVCTVAHERPHHGRAEEHFLPAGPFATLPLPDNRSSIVWTERTDDAKRLLAADPFIFEEELESRFGLHLGKIMLEGTPRAYPLGLTLARSFVAERLALAGDAAHGIHPIAGQGLNLGFKDAAALAQTIVEADRLGLDIGALDTLEDYQRWRRFDTLQMGLATDVLNRLFSNDVAPLRIVRDFGLGLVDRLPALKQGFIRQAAGFTGPRPRLLDGKAI